MIKNITGMPLEKYKRKLNLRYALIACIAAIAAALNVTLCLLYSDSTHALFLAINIVADILAAWFVLFYVSVVIIPQRKMLSLCRRAQFGDKFTAQVVSITDTTTRIGAFNCFEVLCSNERRCYVAENGKICLNAGCEYAFTVVDNIVVEADNE